MNESYVTIVLAQASCAVCDRVKELVFSHAGEVVLGAAVVGLVLLLLFRRWIWRELSALQTAQILMILLVPFLLAGALLPQDGGYGELARLARWGWMVHLAKGLRLMELGNSAPFFILLVMLLITALVCSLSQLQSLFRRRAPGALWREEILKSEGAVTIKVARPFSPEALAAIYDALKHGGLRGPRLAAGPAPPARALEMGSGTSWPSVLYHLGLVFLAIGCLVTFLFGFGGYVSVYSDRPAGVPLVSKEIRWRQVSSCICDEWDRLFRGGKHAKLKKPVPAPVAPIQKPSPEDTLWVGLEKLRVLYKQRPFLNYPVFDDEIRPGSRVVLAIRRFESAWAWGREGLRGAVSNELTGPSSLSAKVVSYIVETESLEHTLKPSRPIQTEGITIVLLGSDYKVDMEVENAVPLKGLVLGSTFMLPGAPAEYYVQYVASGTFKAMDGKEVVLTPTVYVAPVRSKQATARSKAALPYALPLGQTLKLGGVNVRVTAVTEGCILGYWHDPGELIWKAAALLLLLAMCVRIYWSHYRMKLFAEDAGDGTTALHLAVEHHGVLSDPRRAIYRAKRALQAEGLL